MKIQYIRFKIYLSVLFGIFSLFIMACSVSTSAFTGDSDPQLVGDALPFTIKLTEFLLDSSPKDRDLMLMNGSLLIMYSNAFVQGPAEMLPPEEWQARDEAMMRAKQLYLRGNNILEKALDSKYKNFTKNMQDGDFSILKKCKKKDTGFLYWAVAGGLAAYSIDVLDFDLSAKLPGWGAMLQRAYEIDPDYSGTSLDELLFLYYASLPEIMGGDREKALSHFRRAQEKTGGNAAGAYVSYAQAICVPGQDYNTYKEYLEKAIAIDPDADISIRLVTVIAQRKAHWLLDNAWVYFSFLPIPDDY